MTQTMNDQTQTAAPASFWGPDAPAPTPAPVAVSAATPVASRSHRKLALTLIGGLVVVGIGTGAVVALGGHDAAPATPRVTDAAPVATSGSTAQAATPAPSTAAQAPAADPSTLAGTAIQAGDKLATAAEQRAAEAQGLGVVLINGGGAYAIDKGSPLPDAVAQALVAPVKAAEASQGDGPTVGARVQGEAFTAAHTASVATGRHVAVLAKSPSGDGRPYAVFPEVALVKNGLGQSSLSATHDEALAKAQAWIAQQADASDWSIIDATA